MKFLTCICTYKRNISLYKCLKSIEKIILPINSHLTILIVDNTINNNSYSLINKIKKKYRFKIIYINERKRGIVNARNKCLKKAKNINCDYISFIDDDCTIDKNWFKNISKLIMNNNADIITGPQIYKNNKNNLAEIFEKKITTNNSYVKWAASNNVLFKKKILLKENIYFDINLNKFGMGEDQLFFLTLNKLGYKILWSKNLKVFEKVHSHRSNLNWIANRSFRLGVLGMYIDVKSHGLVNGYIINYLKFFYYFFFSFISLLKINQKYYCYQFFNLFIRSIGRLLSPFIFGTIEFYKNQNK
jgi:succinoglycan biosynthesis protein ExoM